MAISSRTDPRRFNRYDALGSVTPSRRLSNVGDAEVGRHLPSWSSSNMSSSSRSELGSEIEVENSTDKRFVEDEDRNDEVVDVESELLDGDRMGRGGLVAPRVSMWYEWWCW